MLWLMRTHSQAFINAMIIVKLLDLKPVQIYAY